MKIKKIAVVGAGPAGMMAAIRAAQLGQKVVLIEKNPAPARKLLLSGKGRCNLTNAGDLDSFLGRFFSNGQFLRDSFRKFFNTELIDFFQARGLKLKTERQLRVFPSEGNSASVAGILRKELNKLQVELICGLSVKDVSVSRDKVSAVILKNGQVIETDAVILATGGVSYSFTGSSGEGLEMARRLGHKVIALRPGLVPLKTNPVFKELQGLTLKNIRIVFLAGQRKLVSAIGEMLFTDSGISGPLVLSLSGIIADWLASGEPVRACLDLKPALTIQQLDNRLLRELKANGKKSVRNIFKSILPLSFVDIFIMTAGIKPDIRASQLNQQDRKKLAGLLKSFCMNVPATLPIEEAMVTRGGVSLKEVDPRTMGSRLVKGLYFAGEILDIDADTGGFNLQAAFSTGYLAGESAALS